MRKVKYLLMGVIVILLVLSTTGSLGSNIVENKNARTCVRGPVPMGSVLEVTTNKIVHNLGGPVIIFLTNVGNRLHRGMGR